MPEVWLDFINPVDISDLTMRQTEGHLHGGADAVRTDDGDVSYIEVSNATRFGAENAVSKVFQLELEPDPTLPAPDRILTYDVRWYSTIRGTVAGGAGVILSRLTDSGSQTIAAGGGTTVYTEDGPRGNTLNGPTWEQIRSGGWLMPVSGTPRLSGLKNGLRVTRLQLWVTYELRPVTYVPPPAHNRGMQRGSDGQGVTGGKRGLQRKSRQSSLRGGSFL